LFAQHGGQTQPALSRCLYILLKLRSRRERYSRSRRKWKQWLGEMSRLIWIRL